MEEIFYITLKIKKFKLKVKIVSLPLGEGNNTLRELCNLFEAGWTGSII